MSRLVRRALAALRRDGRPVRRHPTLWLSVSAVALGVALLAGGALGAVRVPLQDLPRAALDPLHPAHAVLWRVRLPRLTGAVLVGAALAVAGTLMQAVVRNPLADPGLLGVTAGAGLGGLLAIILVPQRPILVPLTAFVGGLLAVATVLAAAAAGHRHMGPLRLLLSGVGVQAILFSLIALVTFAFADRAPAFIAFTVGSLNGVGWDRTALVVGPIVLGCMLALVARRPLDVMLLDDDSAAGVGLGVRAARIAAACLAAWLAAAAASAAGLLAFVGLVVPNWMRLLVGPGHGALLPLAMVAGAALLVVADTIARTLLAPLELPVGALLAFIGGPYFLFVLWRKLP